MHWVGENDEEERRGRAVSEASLQKAMGMKRWRLHFLRLGICA